MCSDLVMPMYAILDLLEGKKLDLYGQAHISGLSVAGDKQPKHDAHCTISLLELQLFSFFAGSIFHKSSHENYIGSIIMIIRFHPPI